MGDFITIKEASQLTGKAEITIRRLIKHLHRHDKARYKQVIKRGNNRNAPINISISYLKQHFGIDGPSKQRVGNEQGAIKPESKTLIDILNETIATLQAQLKTKDEQIAELLRAGERADVLLQNAQKQILMLEHKNQAEAETKKKSSFIKRLFGG